jgi:hypothetical protein
MHDRGGIDLRNPLENALLQFLFGFDANLLQKRMRHFAEERSDQIKPRTMFGRVNIFETVGFAGRVAKGMAGRAQETSRERKEIHETA